MGEVYAGRHIRLDRDVAIKQLPEGFARNETVRGRFGDEARVLASLTHPHIVPVYDDVEEEGRCLLVMEALPGGTVWDRFTSEGISMPTACAVVMATCAGLVDAAPEDLVQVSDVLTPPGCPGCRSWRPSSSRSWPSWSG